MKNVAPFGDASDLVPLDAWPMLLVDPAVEVEASRRYFGHAVRTDRYRCDGLPRPQHMVYLILQGEITGDVDGQPFRLGPDTLFWLPPGVPHSMVWPDRLVFTETWFTVSRGGRDVRFPESVLVVEDAGETWPTFRRLEDELSVGGLLAEQRLRLLLADLAVDVLRLRERRGSDPVLTMTQRRRLIEYVRDRIGKRLSVEDLADVVELTPDYFSRVFRRTFGCPPRDWMVRERLREAARLLTGTNLAVYQVADQLGYANVSQFNRQFREHTGEPPRRYRQRHRA